MFCLSIKLLKSKKKTITINAKQTHKKTRGLVLQDLTQSVSPSMYGHAQVSRLFWNCFSYLEN